MNLKAVMRGVHDFYPYQSRITPVSRGRPFGSASEQEIPCQFRSFLGKFFLTDVLFKSCVFSNLLSNHGGLHDFTKIVGERGGEDTIETTFGDP